MFDEVHIHSKFFMFFVDNMQKILSYKSIGYGEPLAILVAAAPMCCVASLSICTPLDA
ncbi:hypothetical protein [Diaphorobacter sp.]|uniref:hypothetical protein n=1 Tax=Diaphorobacter sp. TaxID=1934310 RepID=UPI0025878F99|nr:hypothetical protein [Diaphorobacter sp.]